MVDTEILAQLTQIKWLLAIFVIVMLISICIRTGAKIMQDGGFGLSKLMRNSAEEAARSFLDAGEDAKAFAAAAQLITDSPGNATGFWIHATAAYRVGNMQAALRSLRKVAELQPDWNVSYVQPFILTIESQASPNGQKADLHLISPNTTLDTKVSPTTLDPRQPSS